MERITVKTKPIEGQKPGTSGLRKKTHVFMGPHYLENFVQAIWNGIGGAGGKTFVLGGDGRYFNDRAAQVILRMAAASGAKKVIVGQNALLSTPAASNLIRKRKTDGGIIMSASHNPGGPDKDFGVKFNTPNGGPAPEDVTNRIFAATKNLASYDIVETQDIDLSTVGTTTLDGMEIEVVDPVADYAELMETLFDFDRIRALFAGGFTMRFDAMHAVTGPYATRILEGQLGAPKGTVINGTPSPDFGGGHPDPNPIWAKPLVDLMMSADAPDFAAASDGDGDRNMILGRGIYVTPSDSLAVLAANAKLAPASNQGTRRRSRRHRTPRPRLRQGPRRCRALHADLRRRRSGRQGQGHFLLRDADGLEVLRQSSRCRKGHALRRGIRRHRLRPRARERRSLGRSSLAQHSRRDRQVGEGDPGRPLAHPWTQLLLAP